MFGFFKKSADVIDHWYTLVPSFNSSAKEFYEDIEKELKTREVPDLEMFMLISPRAESCRLSASICE